MSEGQAVPQEMRLRLTHALLEHIARLEDVELLHIKGYAAAPDLYLPTRHSSDVDVLVRPAHVPALLAALKARGWRAATSYKTGSVFQHAMTLWHDSWGYVDVHRLFPGVGIAPSAFFDRLWEQKTERAIADVICRVPSHQHQALLIVLHAGRDVSRGSSDVTHLRGSLNEETWRRLRDDAKAFKAELAFAAAMGELANHENDPEHDVWAAVSQGGSRLELLRARARAAQSIPARLRLYGTAAMPNRDHLRLALRREPRLPDYAKELWGRLREMGQLLSISAKNRRT